MWLHPWAPFTRSQLLRLLPFRNTLQTGPSTLPFEKTIHRYGSCKCALPIPVIVSEMSIPKAQTMADFYKALKQKNNVDLLPMTLAKDITGYHSFLKNNFATMPKAIPKKWRRFSPLFLCRIDKHKCKSDCCFHRVRVPTVNSMKTHAHKCTL